MPKSQNDELGRRRFQLQKEKVVEEIIEILRKQPLSDMTYFTSREVSVLKYLLGEAWITIKRDEWGEFRFSQLTKKDIESIIGTGKAMNNEEITEKTAVDNVISVLSELA